MPIKHAFQSAVADAGTAGEIGPSEWNDNHTFPPFVVTLSAEGITLTNMGSGFAVLTAPQLLVDLTHAVQFRTTMRVRFAGASGAVARVQYSPDQTTWVDFGALADVNMSMATVTTQATAWLSLPTGARADVYLRIGIEGGDGAADPTIGTITLQHR
ncbi:MAG: hypothetical protein M3Q71_02795 [Chloroflexota bacterium]|nr:hypothetical protein [Chloroflexota bacterium]